MVDARSDSKKQSDVSTRAKAGKRLGSGRLNYTPSDTEKFEKLTELTQVRGGLYAASEDPPETSEPKAYQYTENDAREFQKLMAFVDRNKGARRSPGQSKPSAAGNSGYSASDNRLFDEMMAFDHQRAAITATPTAREQRPAASAVQYSRQDLQAFAKLLPDELPGEDRRAGDGKRPRSRPDRDVGHIKIVDFDSEHAREKESRRRGNPNIKVRYFD